ncbi:MAG: protein-L-isoaspartate(D-aspartate) O-methyltransferase [Spirochaetia bacterium]
MRLLLRIAGTVVVLAVLTGGRLSSQTGASGAFEERADERERMVERTIVRRGVDDPRIVRTMKKVPRHEFVPDDSKRLAYADRAIPIGHGQTISQPYIVAYMTELLNVEKGDKVLEIGTGSGYQAAVLAEITDGVYTVEIIRELAESARRRLERLGYTDVEVLNADGYYGWEEHAPYDRIIVTAAAGHVPPPLIDQLVAGGRIIIPVGGIYQTQNLTLIRKAADGEITTEQLLPVRFVPFTGEALE